MRTGLLLLPVLFLVSCAKDDVKTFDDQITCAKDFRTNAAGDTIYVIYMPSGFTPNGDGKNDAYYLDGRLIEQEDFEMRIFNRYGDQIYYSANLNNGWRGNARGGSEILPNGLYEAQVQAKDSLGDLHKYSYRVHLLR